MFFKLLLPTYLRWNIHCHDKARNVHQFVSKCVCVCVGGWAVWRDVKLLHAGGWSMTQKSPTNEDASDVIVIWFWDAGITYPLPSWDMVINNVAVAFPCFRVEQAVKLVPNHEKWNHVAHEDTECVIVWFKCVIRSGVRQGATEPGSTRATPFLRG